MTQYKTGSHAYRDIVPYLAGLLTSFLIFVKIFLFVGYKIGFSNLTGKLWGVLWPSTSSEDVLDMPQQILDELKQLGAVIENAYNPTNQTKHNTILVQPDENLGFVLRPHAKISGFMLRAANALNLDPPVVYLRSGASMSNELRTYLNRNTRLEYSYSVDADGRRVTLPIVQSAHRILMVGDSVLFGVGVNDSSTMASKLQSLIGNRYTIVNAGVGNYGGMQAFEMANELSKKSEYAGLIYIASQNDFMGDRGVSFSDEANIVLQRFSSLKERFSKGITVMLVTYMQYNLHDVFLERGWRAQTIAKTDMLRRSMARRAEELECEYVDWTEIVEEHMMIEGSLWARFALYVDHGHLSPVGNSLAAKELYERLKRRGVIGGE